ncbi:MAG: serine/threonine-protein kinase [Nannocystaceae bacterium]
MHSLGPPSGGSLDGLDPSLVGALRELAAAPALDPGIPVGTVIGDRYAIEAQVGRGGMGVVYRARDLELDRPVAIKFHAALDDPRAAARMTGEARAMARLAHPNVLTVHEVGRFEGRVFLAMEWAEGGDLRRWLAAEPRGWEAIVERFVAAGEGLWAAHRVGLVHRDFKPSNVLLDGDGRVRVADFGLAAIEAEAGPARRIRSDAPGSSPAAGSSAGTGTSRAPAPGGASETDAPAPARGLGTPAYMAPEQRAGLDVDARADQYSFCAALHEALTGALPGEPPRDPRPLPARIARALARGLRAAPAERFPDMPALLDALRPELARRRRRRILVAVAAVAVAITGVALGWALRPGAAPISCAATAWEAATIWPAARREVLAARFGALDSPYAADAWPRVRALVGDYVDRLASAQVEACRDTHERGLHSTELLDRRMACLSRARRELDARLGELARVDAGSVARAIPLATSLPDPARCGDLERMEEEEAPEPDPARAARIDAVLSALAEARARVIAGAPLEAAEQVIALGPEIDALARRSLDIDRHHVLGDAYGLAEHAREGREHLEAGYVLARAAGDDARAAALATAIAHRLDLDQAAYRESLFWARIARAELERSGGDPELEVRLFLIEGGAEDGLGELQAALDLFDRARERLAQAPSSRPDQLAQILSFKGITLERMGRFQEAIATQEETLARIRAALGDRHPNVIHAENLLGTALSEAGRYEEAITRYQEAIALAEALFGRDPPIAEIPLANLAVAHGDVGRFREAIPILERVRAIQERAAEPNPETVATTLEMLGEYHAQIGDVTEGLALLGQAGALLRGQLGDDHPRVAQWRVRYAETIALTGDLRRSLAEQRAAADALLRAFGPDHPSLLDSWAAMGIAERDLGHLADAEATLRRTEAAWARVDASHPHAAYASTALGGVLIDLGRPAEALPLLEAALKVREAAAVRPWDLAETRWQLARGLAAAGDPSAAARTRALALAARETFREHPDQVDAREVAALERFLAERPEPAKAAGPEPPTGPDEASGRTLRRALSLKRPAPP